MCGKSSREYKERKPTIRLPSGVKKGVLLEDAEEIKSRYLEHFVEILQPPEAANKEEEAHEEIINIAFNNIVMKARACEGAV